jgi:hypothetical protein
VGCVEASEASRNGAHQTNSFVVSVFGQPDAP